MVHLQKLHRRFAKNGVLVFAIAMLPGRERVREMTRDLGVTYPVFFGAGSDLGRRYAYG
jgi:hypothetical protein